MKLQLHLPVKFTLYQFDQHPYEQTKVYNSLYTLYQKLLPEKKLHIKSPTVSTSRYTVQTNYTAASIRYVGYVVHTTEQTICPIIHCAFHFVNLHKVAYTVGTVAACCASPYRESRDYVKFVIDHMHLFVVT